MSTAAHVAVSVALLAAVLGAVFVISGPTALVAALTQVKPTTVLLLALLLATGVILSSLRLKLIATSLGFQLPLRDAVMALTVGQIAGSLFFQFFGQLLGRALVLAGRGISPAASVVLFGYERIFALLVSLGLATAGALYLFGTIHFDLAGGGLSLVRIAAGLAIAVAAGAAFAWGKRATRLWKNVVTLAPLSLGWTGLLSLTVQLTTLAAYVLAGRTLAPEISLTSLIAASCVIMFAASLPISFGGWGLRELSALVVLQAIGFSSASALVASLLIGVVSLVVLAVGALAFQFFVPATFIDEQPAMAIARPDYTLALDWILPIAAATAVFFQIYVPTGGGVLNVNLADPVVLIGCSLYLLRHITTGWPNWRVPHLTLLAVAATAVILLSFLHGFAIFGYTEWSFANRTLGWGMLLCYAATGALIVERSWREGYEVLIKTFVATGAAVSVLNTILLVLNRLAGNISYTEQRLAGFSQNPNAFAFILLMTLAAALTLRLSERMRTTALTCIIIGIWYTGSRAGVGSAVIVLALAVWWGVKLRTIAYAILTTAAIVLAIKFIPQVIGQLFSSDINFVAAMPWTERQVSDNEHLQSVWDGFMMFLSHPIFGAGLGAFITESAQRTGTPLIIHSTAVWVMAEAGILGFAVFIAAIYQIVRTEFPRRRDPISLMILLMIGGLAVMSTTHELLYQRAFWLLLGAALAYPALTAGQAAEPSAAPPKD
jgi:hypothetical protein